MLSFPRLPVLGWAAYAGKREAPLPGVLDARHRRYTISGRAAISLALQVLGCRSNNKVLLPTYHCTTMVEPVIRAGMVPCFYPITADGAPDLHWLERADLDGVCAILVAHYFGLPQPMARVRQFCDDHGIGLIEDCAHAFFGSSDGKPVGTWGDVAIASLTKFFPVTEGGVVASDTRPLDALDLTSRSLRDELRAVADVWELGAQYGRFPGLNPIINAAFGLKRSIRRSRSSTSSGTEASAGSDRAPTRSLLDSARPTRVIPWIAEGVHHERIVLLRRRNYQHLARLLADLPGARPLVPELPPGAVPYVFPLFVDDPDSTYQRVRASGVPIFCWDQLWPGTPQLESDYGTTWSSHVFQLGCHQDLTPRDIEAIAATVRSIVGNSR